MTDGVHNTFNTNGMYVCLVSVSGYLVIISNILLDFASGSSET